MGRLENRVSPQKFLQDMSKGDATTKAFTPTRLRLGPPKGSRYNRQSSTFHGNWLVAKGILLDDCKAYISHCIKRVV